MGDHFRVKLGHQRVPDGIARMVTKKTGVTVTIPVLPALAAMLKSGPTGDLAFMCRKRRMPSQKESLGNEFRDS